MRSRTLLTPQGDGNTSDSASLTSSSTPLVPHPPYPARGRKLTGFGALPQPVPFRSPAPSLPRKGTETLGQRCRVRCWPSPAPSLPRKGTETVSLNSYTLRSSKPGPAPSLPRKGTETVLRLCSIIHCSCLCVPHPPYPARGRKRQRFINSFGESW